ncbi:MAG TPA: zinc ribbon domain-containing protein [Candidatus Limnocylindrales bacterium]|nr:zinc ribbon domain-containing protein [Candidatus Limnocylindrales bacterium]
MDQVFAEIGKAVGGFFGSPVVQFVIYSILAYLVVLWLASAYWVFRDMQQRTVNAILPYLAASLVIVFLPVFPAAVFVYKIIRPHEKIGEVYERNLAEEALLAEVEAVKSCPTCARRVNEDWIICPTCRTRLNRVCPNCSRLVGLDWSLCAWCGKDFERPATALASSTGRPVPLPALSGDESDRVAARSYPAIGEIDADERRALSSVLPRTRSPRAPGTGSPRTAPDVLPEG